MIRPLKAEGEVAGLLHGPVARRARCDPANVHIQPATMPMTAARSAVDGGGIGRRHVDTPAFGAGLVTVGWQLMDAEQARSLAGSYLAGELPQRWRHVQGVARRAAQISPSVVGSDDTLVCAAWLHDIGYAPALVATGFHPLDGARFLESLGASRRLAGLVAHHSLAVLEAELRGLADELAEFEDEDGAVRDALWYCDITTSPDGELVAAADRIAEIKRRYGPGHLVTRFINQATPGLLAAVGRTEQVLGEAGGS